MFLARRKCQLSSVTVWEWEEGEGGGGGDKRASVCRGIRLQKPDNRKDSHRYFYGYINTRLYSPGPGRTAFHIIKFKSISAPGAAANNGRVFQSRYFFPLYRRQISLCSEAFWVPAWVGGRGSKSNMCTSVLNIFNSFPRLMTRKSVRFQAQKNAFIICEINVDWSPGALSTNRHSVIFKYDCPGTRIYDTGRFKRMPIISPVYKLQSGQNVR